MNLMAVLDLRLIRYGRWGNFLLEEVAGCLWISSASPIET